MRLSHSSSEKDTSPQSAVSQQHIKLKQAWSWVHFGINPILLMVVVSLVVLMISRLGLTIWHWDQVPSNGLFKILLGAIRIDFASVCALYALPLLAVTIGSLLPKVRLGLWFVRVLQVYCAAAVSFLVMNEAATPSFIMEYGVRPNHLYVQYLRYPREVISMLWQGHKLSLILGVILTVVTFVLSYRIAAWAFQGRKQAVAVEVQQQIGTLSKIKADRNSNSNSESEEQLSLFHSLGQKSRGGGIVMM